MSKFVFMRIIGGTLSLLLLLSLTPSAMSTNSGVKRLLDREAIDRRNLKHSKSDSDLALASPKKALVRVIQKYLSENLGIVINQGLDEDSIALLTAKMEELTILKRAMSVWKLKDKLPSIKFPNCRNFRLYKAVKMISLILDKNEAELESFISSVHAVYDTYFKNGPFHDKVYRTIFMALAPLMPEERTQFQKAIIVSKKDLSTGLTKLKIPRDEINSKAQQTVRRFIKALSPRINDVTEFSQLFSQLPHLSFQVLERCPDAEMAQIIIYTKAISNIIEKEHIYGGVDSAEAQRAICMMLAFKKATE